MTYGSSQRDGKGENLFELKGLSNPTNGVMYRCDEFCSLIRSYRMMFHVAADDFLSSADRRLRCSWHLSPIDFLALSYIRTNR
jgi:hypothetical protein